jgi:hypothetical protein
MTPRHVFVSILGARAGISLALTAVEMTSPVWYHRAQSS